MSDEIFEYIRKDGKKVGVLVAVLDDDATVRIGWSACHVKTINSHNYDVFDNGIGYTIAINRCNNNSVKCFSSDSADGCIDFGALRLWTFSIIHHFPNSIKYTLYKFITRALRYYKNTKSVKVYVPKSK